MTLLETIITLLFISIPESAAVFFLTLQWVGAYHREMKLKIAMLAVLGGLVTGLTYFWGMAMGGMPFLNLLANYAILGVLVSAVLGMNFRQSYYLMAWAVVLSGLYQIALLMVFYYGLGFNLSAVLNQLSYRLVFGNIHNGLIALTAYWLIRKEISLPQSIRIEKHDDIDIVHSEKSRLALVFLLNLGLFTFAHIYIYIWSKNLIGRTQAELTIAIMVILFVTINWLMLAKQWQGWQKRKIERITEEKTALLKRGIQNQRDFLLEQVETLKQLLHEQDVEKANYYVGELYQRLTKYASLSLIAEPAVYVFLKAKIDQGEEEGIALQVDLEDDPSRLPMAPFEIVKVLGRMIDSSFEIARLTGGGEVKLTVRQVENQWIVRIVNPGVQGDLKGQAAYLASARTLVEKYKGKMELMEEAVQGIVHQISLPGGV